jgi:hypothetical protein
MLKMHNIFLVFAFYLSLLESVVFDFFKNDVFMFFAETDIIEVYQKSTYRADFQSVDLFEMGVRVLNHFRFAVKTKRDAHVLLQNKRTDFTKDRYLVIIAGWGGGKSVIHYAGKGVEYLQTGLVSADIYT